MSRKYVIVPFIFTMIYCNPKKPGDVEKTQQGGGELTIDSLNDASSKPIMEESPSLSQVLSSSIDDIPYDKTPIKMQPVDISLARGKNFQLQIPDGWRLRVADEGLKRLRFLANSPDGRLFATNMHDRSDNKKGKIQIFEGFDKANAKFDTLITYLDKLRNPNSITFYTEASGKHWLYVALTHQLIRYPYLPGDTTPSATPEVLATFPDYGLDYKYGGWHLTRTIDIHNDKLYVSVGSSCNVCEEKEAIRASVVEMDLDGNNMKHFAYGVRNAVGIKWVKDHLFSTNMGADHLGDDKPEEALYVLKKGRHYGWPYFYETNEEIKADTSFAWTLDTLKATDVPKAWSPLGPHSAPLGFSFFEGDNWPESIRNYFLVALHGSGYVRIGQGFEVVRTRNGHAPEPVITGFLQDGDRKGRPCDVFIYDENSFFITDDHFGVLYYVETKLGKS